MYIKHMNAVSACVQNCMVRFTLGRRHMYYKFPVTHSSFKMLPNIFFFFFVLVRAYLVYKQYTHTSLRLYE